MSVPSWRRATDAPSLAALSRLFFLPPTRPAPPGKKIHHGPTGLIAEDHVAVQQLRRVVCLRAQGFQLMSTGGFQIRMSMSVYVRLIRLTLRGINGSQRCMRSAIDPTREPSQHERDGPTGVCLNLRPAVYTGCEPLQAAASSLA